MGQRSGVGLVELAIPEALDARRGRPAGGPVSCEKLLAALEDELGLPRLLPVMIRTWTRAHHDEDLPASLTALENALASRRQTRPAECS